MKSKYFVIPFTLVSLMLAGCSDDSDTLDEVIDETTADAYIDPSVGDDLSSFDIVLDKSTLKESETIPSD